MAKREEATATIKRNDSGEWVASIDKYWTVSGGQLIREIKKLGGRFNGSEWIIPGSTRRVELRSQLISPYYGANIEGE